MADRHPELDFVFVYTREAHPGELVSHHRSFDEKLAHARKLRDEIGIRRPILVDDLSGTAHRRYGLLPNMTWVVARGGQILYKADWTSAQSIDAFLTRSARSRQRRQPGATSTPFLTEQVEFRQVDRSSFYRHLEERNGPRALAEFKAAEKLWSQ